MFISTAVANFKFIFIYSYLFPILAISRVRIRTISTRIRNPVPKLQNQQKKTRQQFFFLRFHLNFSLCVRNRSLFSLYLGSFRGAIFVSVVSNINKKKDSAKRKKNPSKWTKKLWFIFSLKYVVLTLIVWGGGLVPNTTQIFLFEKKIHLTAVITL